MDVLAAKRISRDTEASSALERQDAELRGAIADGGHNLVHMVEDATVSGAINLDQRKSLGEWLREPKVHEWQALMVTTQDRITRDDLHWHQFVGWCLENGKHVIVLDDPGLDISTPRGRLVAGVKASMAADYRHAVKDKRAKQTAYYRDVDLWHGGNWPWGYRTARKEHEGKKRWVLAVDPVTSALAHEAHTRIVKEGWALNRLRVDWNTRAVMTPRDQRHVNATLGREGVSTAVKGAKWTVNQLEAVLTSPALLGSAIHKGEIRRRNGKPVQWADPIFTPEEFAELQTTIRERKSPRGKKLQVTPLQGVVYCGCGQPFDRAGGGVGRTGYYACRTRSHPPRCGNDAYWPVEWIQTFVAGIFLETVGNLEVHDKRYVPGRDNTARIDELRRSIANLAEGLAKATGPAAIDAITHNLDAYSMELANLEAKPVVPSRWEEIPTGETFSELWRRHGNDWTARGELLKQSGVRFYFAGSKEAPHVSTAWPADMQRRLNLVEHPLDRFVPGPDYQR